MEEATPGGSCDGTDVAAVSRMHPDCYERVLQGIPLKDKGQTDSYQRIEAPVRGGEGAAGKIPDGGPPVTERQNSLDQLLIQNDQAQVRTRSAVCRCGLCRRSNERLLLMCALVNRMPFCDMQSSLWLLH